MSFPKRTLLALALAAASFGAATATAGPGDGSVRGHTTLAPPVSAPPSPEGRMDVTIRSASAHHAASSQFAISIEALADTGYTLWADDPATADPALVQFASFTTGQDGRAKLDYDSRDGDPMPFGASLADLGGRPIEMRDQAGAAALEGAIPVATGNRRPPHLLGASDLTRPTAASLEDSAGRIRAEVQESDGIRPAWSRLRIDLRGLAARTAYSLWGDDPATLATDLVQFASVATDARGRARKVYDTRKGDALPFGASLDDLGGNAVEVRDGAGGAVLSGVFPEPQRPPEPEGPPLHGKGFLVPPGGVAPPPPSGAIDEEVREAQASHAARSHLRLKVEHLAPQTTLTIWGDDPSTADATLVQFAALSTDAKGRGALDLDSRDGDPMPFGASLVALAGQAVEVRDGAGVVVLVGEFPSLPSRPHPDPTLHGRSDLTRPPGASLTASRGQIGETVHPVTPGRPAWSRLVIEIRGLASRTEYRLFADDPATADPALAQFAALTTDRHGRVRLVLDTHKGATLPFGATLAALGGSVLQVRYASDAVVLRGEFPTPR